MSTGTGGSEVDYHSGFSPMQAWHATLHSLASNCELGPSWATPDFCSGCLMRADDFAKVAADWAREDNSDASFEPANAQQKLS